MVDDTPINWQQLNLKDDKAFAEGTCALRFLAKQMTQARMNPQLCPILQSLMRAHDMVVQPKDRNHSPSPRRNLGDWTQGELVKIHTLYTNVLVILLDVNDDHWSTLFTTSMKEF